MDVSRKKIHALERQEFTFEVLGPQNLDDIIGRVGDYSSFKNTTFLQSPHSDWNSQRKIDDEAEYVHRTTGDITAITMTKPCPAQGFVHRIFDSRALVQIHSGSHSIDTILNNKLRVLLSRDWREPA